MLDIFYTLKEMIILLDIKINPYIFIMGKNVNDIGNCQQN